MQAGVKIFYAFSVLAKRFELGNVDNEATALSIQPTNSGFVV
jgi:hypothetical protein